MQLFWTQNARKDILGIKEYYESKISKEILLQIISEIQATGNFLNKSPEVGRIAGDDNVRKFSVANYHYILLYKVKNNCVNILRVLDTRKMPISRLASKQI